MPSRPAPCGSLLVGPLLLALLAGGCQSSRQEDRAGSLFTLPESYGTNLVQLAKAQSLATSFNLPELHRLLEIAFRQNLDLRAAWARLREAEALARSRGASLWPQLEAGGDAVRSNTGGGELLNSGDPAGSGTTPFRFTSANDASTQYRVSLSAAYELDLWQRLANLREAAQLDAEAAALDADALALTLGAQVAQTYVEILAQRERIDLLQSQLDVSLQFLQLTRSRLALGQATALDVTQQEQQSESLRGLLAAARGAEQVARQQLRVLLGRPPQEDLPVQASGLPDLPPLPHPGLPGDLVTRRPDVQAARLRLRAGDRLTAAAVADLLPRLRLTAALFYQERELARLFSDGLWTLAASASQPLFEGGRRFAEIDRAEARAEQRLMAYGQTLLVALQEVQEALVLEARQSEVLRSLDAQRTSARTALNLARNRYRLGAVDYLRVLTALLSLQQLEQDLVEGRRQQFSHRIQLCRALGGPWMESSEPSRAE